MKKHERLVDYCQLCGAELKADLLVDVGSLICCKNSIMNKRLQKDFGDITVTENKPIREHIYDFMKNKGYNVENCDICSIVHMNDGATLYRFVHWSVPTMITEPYYRIKFIHNTNTL